MLDKSKRHFETEKKQPSPADEELIASFQGGDIYAFEQIVRRYKDPLTNFVFHFLGNRIDAEDVVQETFLRVYRKKHLYRNVAKFSTWIYTIAGNLAKTELRRRRRRRIFSLSHMGYTNHDYEFPDDMATPEKIVDSEMHEAIIHKEIDSLPVKFKEVVVLRDIQDFSYEEISKILHVPIGTVKSRVNRGRLRLQKRLRFLFNQFNSRPNEKQR